jgi:uncharacterized membrane protein YeaQ/YmgE (transglycosylase-associated protein family)
MAAGPRPTHLARTVVFEPALAVYLWPFIGLAAGGFASLCFRDRGLPVAAANLVFGLGGAGAGGLVTLAFTHGEPESGGFWTSLVTATLGTLVALGLWRALLDTLAIRPDRPPRAR